MKKKYPHENWEASPRGTLCVCKLPKIWWTHRSTLRNATTSHCDKKQHYCKNIWCKMNRRRISQRHVWSPFDTWRGERQSGQRAETEIEVTGVPITAVTSVSRRARDPPTVSTQTLIDKEPVKSCERLNLYHKALHSDALWNTHF